MSEDVVEVIENCPETIEISDEEDEGNIIVLNYDSADSDNNISFITIKEESINAPDLILTATNVETNHEDNLRSVEAQTIRINPAAGKCRCKKRKKTGRRNFNGNLNKVVKTEASSRPNSTGICGQIIKKENESTTGTSLSETETDLSCTNSNMANNNASQNDCVLNNSNASESTATCSTTVSQTENPTNHSKNKDFSKLNWLKPLKNLSSPPNLQLVIIDRGHPDWKIGNDKWLMIEKRLLETLHTEMLRSNDSSIGLFDGAKWQRGIKIIGCHNKKALNFITNFILKLDKLWVGAKLDVCTMAHFVRQICKVFIPPPVIDTDVVLSLIKLQNPTICCEDWEVLGEQERNQGVDLWLSINEESFRHLRTLRGEIKFGINRIFVKPVLY